MRRQRQLDTVTNATTGGGQKHPHTEVKATTHDGQKTACGRFIFPTYSEKQQILKKNTNYIDAIVTFTIIATIKRNNLEV